MSPEGSLANASARLSASVTESLVLWLFTSELCRPPHHTRPWQPGPACRQRAPGGTAKCHLHLAKRSLKGLWQRIFIIWFCPLCGTDRCVSPAEGQAGPLPSTAAPSGAPFLSHQRPRPVRTANKEKLNQAELLLNPGCKHLGFAEEKHGSCHWPSNRFARPRNKPYRSFLHHWNKRQILPSGKAHIAMEQMLEDIWHPHKGGCVYTKGTFFCTLLQPGCRLLAPSWLPSAVTTAEGTGLLSSRGHWLMPGWPWHTFLRWSGSQKHIRKKV